MYKDIVIFSVLHFIFIYFNIETYSKLISSIQGNEIKIGKLPIIIHYISLLSSYKLFVINKNFTVKEALYFGIKIFGIINLSNYILFEKWPLKLSVINSIWGGLLFALSLYLSRVISDKKVKKLKEN